MDQLDIMLIEKEITVKSYKDIAFLLDKPVAEVKAFIEGWLPGKNITPYQVQLDQKKAARPPVVRLPREKKIVSKPRGRKPKKKDPVIISRIIEQEQKVKRARNGLPIFYTKVVDYSSMQQVKVDEKTWIYIKPGQDPEVEKKSYLKRLAQYKSSLLLNKEAV